MATSGVCVRSATPEDGVALLAFLRQFRSEGHAGVFRPVRPLPTLEEEVSWVRSLVEHESSHLWVACEGAAVVGLLDFQGHRHPQMAHGGILGTSLLEAYRGRGLGKELMQTLIGWATRHPRLRRIELEVFSSNAHAIHFYTRQGFVREGARRQAVEVEGRWCDIVLMAREV